MCLPRRRSSPPPRLSNPPPTTPLRRSRSSFAGDEEHYGRWMLLMESTFTELEGNSLRVVSESGPRYTPLQHVLAPFSAGDDDRHRFGRVWSETPAFLTAMVRAASLNSTSDGFPPARIQMDQTRQAQEANDDRIARWLSALVENNEKFGAAPPQDGGDSGDGATFDAAQPDDSDDGDGDVEQPAAPPSI